jgi:hypothetical protein
LAPELAKADSGDGLGQVVVLQHPRHVEVFDDKH